MASQKIFMSPGVFTSEKDLTFVSQQVGVTTLGLAGETVKGPAFEPIFITNYDEYLTIFGGLNYQSSSYDEVDHNFFNSKGEWSKRDGDLTALSLGASHSLNKSIKFRALFTMLDVTSKIDLYEYSRNKLELGAGYQL